jgi:AAHS family 4-hydroxybenzoate transporter-like MFS transporter
MQISGSRPAAAFFEGERFSKPQIIVAGLCALVAMLDGFDTQAIAYVAPRIADRWGLAPAAFGPIFSIGLVGLTVGAFLLSPAADRVGRKAIILLSTALFGVFALMTGTATNLEHLLIYRFLTGIGLGAAMPNLIALTSEYAPARLRATAVTVMFCGFPLGSTIGGLISTPLMQAYDWQAVFVAGGMLPLVLLPVLAYALPESLCFLVARNAAPARLAATIGRIAPGADVKAAIAQIEAEQATQTQSASPLQLFAHGQWATTSLLWVAFFMNLLVMYFLVNWLPTLLKAAGLPLSQAILSTA